MDLKSLWRRIVLISAVWGRLVGCLTTRSGSLILFTFHLSIKQEFWRSINLWTYFDLLLKPKGPVGHNSSIIRSHIFNFTQLDDTLYNNKTVSIQFAPQETVKFQFLFLTHNIGKTPDLPRMVTITMSFSIDGSVLCN